MRTLFPIRSNQNTAFNDIDKRVALLIPLPGRVTDLMQARTVTRTFLVVAILMSLSLNHPAAATPPDYAEIDTLFQKYCVECHGTKDADANLNLESHDALLRGGESGPAIVGGKSSESLLIQLVKGELMKDGKPRFMPPGKRERLSTNEVTQLINWIDTGAKPPKTPIQRGLSLKRITPLVSPKPGVGALAATGAGDQLAVAKYSAIQIVDSGSRRIKKFWTTDLGPVNAMTFSPDGNLLYLAGGQPGVQGVVQIWNVNESTLSRTLQMQKDSIHSLALSADGKLLASGSYDQTIQIWEWEHAKQTRLTGHNGAVFDLAFRADGKLLASTSADRTVKLWDVATGTRRDTLSQPLKEMNSLGFSPDGKLLAGGGADNRIRLWQISPEATETTNPLLESRFAHTGAIVKLRFSPDGKSVLSGADDGTLKLWSVPELNLKLSFEKQPDWPTALTFLGKGERIAVGRADGSWEIYQTADGSRLPPAKPEITCIFPKAVQRGSTSLVKLNGKHLDSITNFMSGHASVLVRLLTNPPALPTQAWAEIVTPRELDQEVLSLLIQADNGQTNSIQLELASLPQRLVDDSPHLMASGSVAALPSSFWGTILKAGETDQIPFVATSGSKLVIEISTRSIGATLSPILKIRDESGIIHSPVQSLEGEVSLLVFSPPKIGSYVLSISDRFATGSEKHFYRIQMGEFPYVTSVFPQEVAKTGTNWVELIGYNLPANSRAMVPPGSEGQFDFQPDTQRFRFGKPFKMARSSLPVATEVEPNHFPSNATPIGIPASVGGRLTLTSPAPTNPDEDLFRFEAAAGESIVFETLASQVGSPADTRIEILDSEGKSVPRLSLHAIRNSAITFRGIDSDSRDCRLENWEEMELNQLLYLQGEVVKLFRAPQGPDSGFQFYGLRDKRICYFDTTPSAHPNEAVCYIVEPRPYGWKAPSNGLPQFVLNYVNDDDGERKLGRDSRIVFTPPKTGVYFVKVSDSRGLGGENFVYQLRARKAAPDFEVTLQTKDFRVNAGSGREFIVIAERKDNFEGEIQVDLIGLSPDFEISSPVTIQAGHTEARGTILAKVNAKSIDAPKALQWKARATVDGALKEHPVQGFNSFVVEAAPKLKVHFTAKEPSAQSQTNATVQLLKQDEIVISPGSTVAAWLSVDRLGHEDLVTFSVENLPHGIIVDNIGLNGVLMPKGERVRQIFLTAAKWVPETTRMSYAVENQAGRQTSQPVIIKVAKAMATQAAR